MARYKSRSLSAFTVKKIARTAARRAMNYKGGGKAKQNQMLIAVAVVGVLAWVFRDKLKHLLASFKKDGDKKED